MKYQAKVNNTQKYEDSQGNHIVTPAKLVFTKNENIVDSYQSSLTNCNMTRIHKKPILISETEEIEVGDWVYDSFQNLGQIQDKSELNFKHKQWKVLALPNHFSDKHLQSIIDGKIKDGDKVLVKCYKHTTEEVINQEYDTNINIKYLIHLDQQNQITLFPPKQSLEEVAKEYSYPSDSRIRKTYREGDVKTAIHNAFKAGAKWAKKNNY